MRNRLAESGEDALRAAAGGSRSAAWAVLHFGLSVLQHCGRATNLLILQLNITIKYVSENIAMKLATESHQHCLV